MAEAEGGGAAAVTGACSGAGRKIPGRAALAPGWAGTSYSFGTLALEWAAVAVAVCCCCWFKIG